MYPYHHRVEPSVAACSQKGQSVSSATRRAVLQGIGSLCVLPGIQAANTGPHPMPNTVKRYNGATVENVPQATATTPLPSTSVCIVTGNYLFNGVGYDCSEPGRYLFW